MYFLMPRRKLLKIIGDMINEKVDPTFKTEKL